MTESIQQRLDRVIDHVEELGATSKQIVLSHDDLDELQGDAPPTEPGAKGHYRDVPVKRGEVGHTSFVEAEGTPSGSTNFGV